MCQVFSDSCSQWFNNSFVHYARNQPQSSPPNVLVVPDQIISERIASQKDLFFERFICGRLRFFDDFPIEKHGLSELIAFVLLRDDVCDNMHDYWWVSLIICYAAHQIFNSMGLFVN